MIGLGVRGAVGVAKGSGENNAKGSDSVKTGDNDDGKKKTQTGKEGTCCFPLESEHLMNTGQA